jgi:hypothetical protein
MDFIYEPMDQQKRRYKWVLVMWEKRYQLSILLIVYLLLVVDHLCLF